MSYSVRNLIKQPIVGNMGDGSPVRIPIKGTVNVSDVQYSGYLEGLAKAGYVSAKSLVEKTKDNIEVVRSVEDKPQKKSKKKEG